MTDDLMRYDLLTQKALRAVVREALIVAATKGIPGDHHFYISFLTGAPGTDISSRLKSQYPEEMTIVLQHQFWDLKVTDEGFSVGLSFDKTPERLIVPYSALVSFFDPSVQFGLQFSPDGTKDSNELATASEAKTTDSQPGTLSTVGGDEPAGEVVNLDAFRKDQ